MKLEKQTLDEKEIKMVAMMVEWLEIGLVVLKDKQIFDETVG
jgi:hypothetical protein